MRSPTVLPELDRIAEQAVQNPKMVFTTLAHHIDKAFLREAYNRTRKDAAAGVDKVTVAEYMKNLDGNLCHLYTRMRTGGYKAQPVRRVWLEKDDKSKRPIGIPVLEDKIVQRAVVMLLEAIYEPIFYGLSYGFRRGLNAHKALSALREQARELNIKWILDVDVSGYFDSIPRSLLLDVVRERMNDGTLLRFIGKWLNAGVQHETGELEYSSSGTPQGGVISPILSNIFLHKVLDDWFEREVKPKMRGRCFLIRYADDFVIGFEDESDAHRVMEVLPKRFSRFGLTIHPTKTKLVPFGRPGKYHVPGKGEGTFDFLGFTHYWARSLRGKWTIKRKTMGKRLRRTLKRFWAWCKGNRHLPMREQYRILCAKLRGHYQYFGLRSNYKMLEVVYEYVEKTWRHWLGRRCSKGLMSWETFVNYRVIFPLPKPRIVHNI